MKKTWSILLIVVSIGALAGFSYGVFITIPNTGHAQMVQYYWDADATQIVTSIDWGDTSPGAVYTKTIWIKNFASKQVTLNLAVGNWTPAAASQYMAFSWNRDGEAVAAGLTLNSTLTLTVYANLTQSGISTWTCDTTFVETWP